MGECMAEAIILARLRAGELAGSVHLKLSEGLDAFPPEIFSLADTLEILDLSGNALTSLPKELPRLHKLRVLFCSGNPFTELPEVLGRCPQLEMVGFKSCRIERVPDAALPSQLRWLILTDNCIAELPAELGRCARLQKLMLSGNRLRALPESLADCARLELLRIAANQLEALPDWLFRLPRLAWLAYAGNPFCDRLEAAALAATPVCDIPWDELTLAEKLGEGASGVIHRAHWRQADGETAVAVKLFKGAVTSDGLPHSEMTACLHACNHAGLIPVLGRVAGHPQAATGLVLELVGPGLTNLAGSPSLESCTRDVYSPDSRFTPETLLGLARGIADAVAHLHAQGVVHGDLYGHNILHDGAGHALLGDFGAASFLAPENAAAMQRIEVRAFGCLLEELLARCDGLSASEQTALFQLRESCLQPKVGERPSLSAVVQRLDALGRNRRRSFKKP